MHKGRLEVEYEPRVLDLPCIRKTNIEKPATVSGNILQRLLRGLPYDCPAKMHTEYGTRCVPSPPVQEQITEVKPPNTLKGAICDILKVAEQAGNKLSPQQVFESLCEQYSNDDIQAIECITTGQSENKCWFEHRIGMITASVAHNVYTRVHTVRTKMGPHDLRALLKLVMRESKVTTADMRRGVKLEPAAKSAYLSQNKKHNHLKIHGRGLCVLQQRPFLGASPDGVVSCACCPARLIEVKCPKSLEQFVRSEVCHGSDPMQLKEKSRYFSQVQVQMGITGLATADVFVFVNDTQTITLNVSFSKEYFDNVVERATFFFLHYVLPHIVQSAS
ncbi:uncharacterized protein LOC144157904 [Haemaphysalis longicornis]